MGGQNLLVRRILFGGKIFFIFYEKNFRTRSQTLFEKKKSTAQKKQTSVTENCTCFLEFFEGF